MKKTLELAELDKKIGELKENLSFLTRVKAELLEVGIGEGREDVTFKLIRETPHPAVAKRPPGRPPKSGQYVDWFSMVPSVLRIGPLTAGQIQKELLKRDADVTYSAVYAGLKRAAERGELVKRESRWEPVRQ